MKEKSKKIAIVIIPIILIVIGIWWYFRAKVIEECKLKCIYKTGDKVWCYLTREPTPIEKALQKCYGPAFTSREECLDYCLIKKAK